MIRVRWRRDPEGPSVVLEISEGHDATDVCEAARKRVFGDAPLRPDPVFEQIMAERRKRRRAE